MKVSKQRAELNREAILNCAAKVFRERGFDGVGVSDLAKAAGLTHGGVYAHFKNKEALALEATQRARLQQKAALETYAEGRNRLEAILGLYLSPSHRDDPGAGCPMAANATEVVRQSPELQRAFVEGIDDLIALIEVEIQKPSDGIEAHALAVVTSAAMLGGLTMARIYAKTAPDKSSHVLSILHAQLVRMHA